MHIFRSGSILTGQKIIVIGQHFRQTNMVLQFANIMFNPKISHNRLFGKNDHRSRFSGHNPSQRNPFLVCSPLKENVHVTIASR